MPHTPSATASTIGRAMACIESGMPATLIVNPPVAAITAASTVAAPDSHNSSVPIDRAVERRGSLTASTQNGQQPRVLFGALGRQRPFGAGALFELRAKERFLHSAVDHAPRQHRVRGAIAVDVEVAIDAGIGH